MRRERSASRERESRERVEKECELRSACREGVRVEKGCV